MSCEELRDDYGAFALGCCENPERDELREHLSRNCPNCVPGVRGARSLVAQMSGLVRLVDPPARLQKRIEALVKPELLDRTEKRSGWSLIWAAASLVFLIAAIFFGIQARNLSERRQVENERLANALDVMSAPESLEITFGNVQPSPPRGKVFLNRRKGVVLMASNLPKLQPGKTFEMWVIPKGGKPVPAGLFGEQPDGSAINYRPGEVDPATIAAVAVSVEDAAGAPQPTTTPIIAAPTQ